MEIIDNINNLFGDSLKSTLKESTRLKIAASCFSIYAFEALKKELEKIDSLQFIFTSPTFVANQVADNLKKEKREFYIPKLQRENSLFGSEFEIRLKNELTQKAIARECAAWIRKKGSFKSNSSNAPMQQFACSKNPEGENVYMPLNGFTAVDLGYQKGNAVSNFVTRIDHPAQTGIYIQLFEQIWNDHKKVEDITKAVCEHIEAVYNDNSPDYIYFVILYNIFAEFLSDINEDVLPNDKTGFQNSQIWKKLFNFQRDAAFGIINKLETYNGCILADSVGLGKTFTALAVIKYYELRNKSVLVLCPKKLVDNWQNYNKNLVTNIFDKDRFNYTVLCHTDLQREKGYSLGIPLDRINWGNFDLVVIDESHNFRNNDAFKDHETRYQKLMNKVVRAGVKTRVLMLSATPVNNRFNDLKNQLALAYEGDADLINNKLKTEKDINEIFRRAQAAFNVWSKLPPEQRTPAAILEALDFNFFELLDSVTIARSRKHIQKYYDTRDIGSFPVRCKPISLHSPLTSRSDVINFNEIFDRLITINMAVYAPFSYILPSRLAKYEEIYDTRVKGGFARLKQSDREKSLQALMTVNLLKRLESSIEAFRLSLKSLKLVIEDSLSKIHGYRKTKNKSDQKIDDFAPMFEDIEADEAELPDFSRESSGGKVQISLEDMDIPSWESDLNSDLAVLDGLLNEMQKINPAEDAKLQQLMSIVSHKIKNPINSDNKKILIFTAFADTAEYLFNNVAPWLRQTFGLHSAKVTGSSVCRSTLKKSHDFQTLLTFFSPLSKEKAMIFPKDTDVIDLLIGTDCISEGQNLQDCDYMVNYDIHWNPVRIIQRFGRIDRIGSKNQQIQMVNFWPDITLDEYINLKSRVENRMVIADVSATGDDNVLSAEANDLAFRKEQLKKLQDEVIDLEDVKTGISITDLGLNDFRMDLINYVKQNGDLDKAPKGMHAVLAARTEIDLHPGVIFVLRNTSNGINLDQQNRLHPYYLLYISETGTVRISHTEPKKILDLIRTSCRGINSTDSKVYSDFNHETSDGRNMKAYSKLLEKGIHAMINVKEVRDVESLFSPGGTSALTNDIKGLSDFELIAFLVVRAN